MSRRFFFKNEACVEKKQTIKVRNVVVFFKYVRIQKQTAHLFSHFLHRFAFL